MNNLMKPIFYRALVLVGIVITLFAWPAKAGLSLQENHLSSQGQQPASSNYILLRSTTGSSHGKHQSSNFHLLGSSGQPSPTGQMTSTTYQVASGFWSKYFDPLPQVVSITRIDPNPTSKKQVGYSVRFSESVIGVDAEDFTLTAVSGSITNFSVTSVDPNTKTNPELATATYTVTIETGDYNGVLRLDLLNDGSIQDSSGNQLVGGYVSGQTYAVEKLYRSTLRSQAKYDGWVLESSEFSGVGHTTNDSGKVLRLGDDEQDKQFCAILSFGTGGIPDNAVITKVILKVKRVGVTGTDPMTTHNGLVVDIKKGKFYTRPTLQVQDFQARAAKYKIGKFSTTLYSGWYKAVLYKGAYTYINKKGRTQFRLRFLLDDNDDNSADILKLYSGNAVLANRPKLIVKYYVP
jgi:hypothetical protein